MLMDADTSVGRGKEEGDMDVELLLGRSNED